MAQVRAGLLPLYLALYDECRPETRPEMEAFVAKIAAALEGQGIAIESAPVCRLKPEFADAVKQLELADVDAIITLHLAYSPSLESAEALAGTELPLIVLDTTPDHDFGFETDSQILHNHGIHGVQDMCNLLIRNDKGFTIEAGHWKESDVIKRVASHAKAAALVTAMRTAKVGIIGQPFEGMGDFAIPFDQLQEDMGMQTVCCTPELVEPLIPAADDPAVLAEADRLRSTYDCEVDDAVLCRSLQACLAVRKMIEQEGLTAFTANFLHVGGPHPMQTMPFIEACLGMARGVGYAGEGDVMTAALVGALASVYPQSTFTEMFCPDWHGGRVFLSHMGEANLDLLEDVRITEAPFPFSPAENPAKSHGCLKAGEAVFVNLAPGPDRSYTLILAPVTMVAPENGDKMVGSMRGWMWPHLPLERFLEAYSRHGGTHHAALVYNADIKVLSSFANMMGWDAVEI